VPRLRSRPEDFRVEEVPLYAPAGHGEHTFVQVEKRLRTTEEVARALARLAGARPRDVGYAGRKDRDAVTTQWYSVPGLEPERARELDFAGAVVLAAERHPHKLRTGQLGGNRFCITVRDVDAALAARAAARLAELADRGMPNRFGAQRFGADGDNAARGARLLRGERVGGDRRAQRFLLSALQAAVFNEVLASRAAPLDAVERGEVAMVHESGGAFVVEDAVRESERARRFEISATGPIFGTRLLAARGAAAERESAALRRHGVDLAELRPPRGVRLRGARRPLRVRPRDASSQLEGGALVLRFGLPPGSYATVLLEEVLGADAFAPASSG
jgi:tRNA pseudouridine13 synthase